MEKEKDVLTIENGVVTACDKSAVDVLIPEGVTAIGESAFQNCEALKTVSFPLTLTTIGKSAFEACKSLSAIELPLYLKKLDSRSFFGCESLGTIWFNGTGEMWRKIEKESDWFIGIKAQNVNCLLKIENGVLTRCHKNRVKNVVIPEGVTAIGEMVFNYAVSLKSVVIPDSVREFGEGAFWGCSALEDVTIPKGVTKISVDLFAACTSLKSLKIPDTVTQIKESSFFNCESLESIVIPKGVTEICDWTFKLCSSLKSITIPEGVTRIGVEAFKLCKSLSSIEIPSTVTEIGKDAFIGCEAVEKIVSLSPIFLFDEKTKMLYDSRKKRKIAILSLAKEVEKQKKIAQVQNTSAKAVLDSILAEHNVKADIIQDEKDFCLRIKVSAGGVEVLLPIAKVSKWMNTLPALLDLAKNGADILELGKYMSENALEDASKKYLSTRNGVANGKLKSNEKPVYLVIPDGVTTIKLGAFFCCKTILSLVIPSSVKNIDNAAFQSCKSLSFIVFKGTVVQWNSVEKGAGWCDNVHATEIHCSDGDVQL